MRNETTKITDISRNRDQLLKVATEDLMQLPYPYDGWDAEPKISVLSEQDKGLFEASLDGVSAILIPKPKSKEEEDALCQKFL